MDVKPKILELKGDKIEHFRLFTEQITNYFNKTETDKKSNEVQVAKLKTLMGFEALELYNTLRNNDSQESVSYILKVLQDYCTSKNNILLETYRFLTRKQQVDETIEDYYSELKKLVKRCDFEKHEEKLLRAQLVTGIQNVKIQEKILTEDMCLENIILYCSSEKIVASDAILVKNDVDRSDEQVPPFKKFKEDDIKLQIKKNIVNNVKNCSNCTYHDSTCPAKGRKCNKCKKPNHFIGSKGCKLRKGINICNCIRIEIKEEDFNNMDEDSTHFLSSTELDNSDMGKPRKTFTCDACNKTYNDPRNLVRHKRLHTGELPFVCEFCSKGFRDRGDLNKHVRYHTGEKNFECNQCLKKFFRNHDLQNHLRTHTGEKPWVCEVCAKTFITHATLNIHRRSHTGEKPYECDICKKRFTQLTDVKRHRRLHTDERPYGCRICSRRFNENSQLKRHLTTHSK